MYMCDVPTIHSPDTRTMWMVAPCSRFGLALAMVLLLNLQIAITKSSRPSETCQSTTATATGAMGAVSTLAKKNITANNPPHREVSTASALLSTDPSTLDILQDLRQKYKHQPIFLQAVEEMALSVADLLEQDPFYRRAFAMMTEPERTISFRVPWTDDHGHMHYNRGWRVEFSRYVAIVFVAAAKGWSCWMSMTTYFSVVFRLSCSGSQHFLVISI